jgi:hypothetical protein
VADATSEIAGSDSLHCEERSDEAIQVPGKPPWIASLTRAMTKWKIVRTGADTQVARSSKQPNAFRAFERAERQERAQRPASGFCFRPLGRRHRLLALPVTRTRHEAAARAAAAPIGAIAPIFQQRTLRLRHISVAVAIRQYAPLLERHPPRKAPIRRTQLSSHVRLHPARAASRDGQTKSFSRRSHAPECCSPRRRRKSKPLPAIKREAERRKAHAIHVRAKRGARRLRAARRLSALMLAALATSCHPDGSAPEPGFLKARRQGVLPVRRIRHELSTLRADRSFCRPTGDPEPPGNGWHIRARAPPLASVFQACPSGKAPSAWRGRQQVTDMETVVKDAVSFIRTAMRRSRSFVVSGKRRHSLVTRQIASDSGTGYQQVA